MENERASVDTSDGEDVRAALGGDLEAYGCIVERYQEVAFRAAWLILRDEGAAQDVCQEAFLRAHRGLARFRTDEPLRPWLLRIVTNLAKNVLRSRSRRASLLDRLRRMPESVVPLPERAVEAAEQRVEVLDAVARLPADAREAIELRYYLDLSEAEMATVLGVRPGTVKSRLSRARQRLRAEIAERHPDLVPDAIATEERDA